MQIFNTLTHTLEEFQPRTAGEVGMYVCGPTVQASPHVGHGRAAVVFDIVRRYLMWRGYGVTMVVNVTDVDDKIIEAAQTQGVSPNEIATAAQAEFDRAYAALGILEPTHQPRATETIPEMIDLIGRMIAADHAYAADGDVYFAVRSFDGYGRLSRRSIDDLLVGARVEPGEKKRDPLDFALWKASKPGEPSWDSPWGPGRPGWHIECSAMAAKFLGQGFDIHGGGSDLIFPHHENEVAQSESVDGPPFARYWMHNGMLNLSGEKMAKSTGLVVDLLSLLSQYNPLAVRLFYLRTHYRKPLDYTDEAIQDAVSSLERLWAFRRRAGDPRGAEATPEVVAAFRESMDHDLDTAGAIAVLFDAVREGNKVLDSGEPVPGLAAAYDVIVGTLGLLEPAANLVDLSEALAELAGRFSVEAAAAPEMLVDELVTVRTRARTDGEYTKADDLRDALGELGIVVEDGPDGSRWHRLV